MSYLSDRDRQRKNGWWGLATIIALILLVVYTPLGNFVRELGVIVVTPWWHTQSGVVGLAESAMTSKRAMREQILQLEQALEAQANDVVRIAELERDNQELRTSMSRSKSGQVILSIVQSRPPQTPYDTLIIDVGEDDGVEIGQRVVSFGDIAVGTISEVSKSTAIVELASKPGYVTPAMISGELLFVELIGAGGGNFTIKLPRELTLESGTALLIPSFENYVVGIVEDVSFDPRDPFQLVRVRSPINMQHLKFVEVVID